MQKFPAIWYNHEFHADINECQSGENDCDVSASCENTGGNYTCHCRMGFSGNGINCSDIDECTSDSNNCDQMANCTNTNGSYVCTCRDGYTGDGMSCSSGCRHLCL